MATGIILPPIEVLASAAAELVEQTTAISRQHALNKAALYLHHGVAITPTAGGFLIPSGTRAGVVHRVSTTYGCGCEAGVKGRDCWHALMIAIVEKAQTRAIPALGDRLATARREKIYADMDALYG